MIEAINADDLTPKLYAKGLISEADKIKIDNQQNDDQKKNTFLLTAVRQAIIIDCKNFEVFLIILEAVPKYKPLCKALSSD